MLLSFYIVLLGFPGASSSKESAFSGGDPVRKIPWRRGWQPTPVFLPGEFHGQSSLVGYSLQDHKKLDTFTFHINMSNVFIILIL